MYNEVFPQKCTTKSKMNNNHIIFILESGAQRYHISHFYTINTNEFSLQFKAYI